VNTPLPVSGTVQVDNSATSPVLVRDVDNPARHVFASSSSAVCSPAANPTNVCFTVFTVPVDKLLVIETASVQVQLQTNQRAAANLNFNAPSSGPAAAIPLQFQGNFTAGVAVSGDLYSGVLSSHVYANPGTQVSFGVLRNSSTGLFVISTTIAGYLVDCGAGAGCPLP
jgi:hypothetical protein